MKRWNGWGHHTVTYPLKPEGQAYLEAQVGPGRVLPDADVSGVLARVPASRLSAHLLIKTDAKERMTHSLGQSFPDWVAMHSGQFPAFVDGVATPVTDEDVRALLAYARDTGARLVPYGGGTSVVGHLTPRLSDRPTLSVDMGHMARLTDFDETSQLATFGAGIAGPDIEAQLRARGYTLGHYPQSFEFSTLGGWIATRSSGQQSRFYGRIEQMYAGGSVETPVGTLEIPPFPASAAGTDLREMVLGSEGRLGVITRAIVRVARIPEYEAFEGIVFPSFEQAFNAVRAIAQAALPVSMTRLSNALETRTNLALAGGRTVALLEKYLAWRGADEGKCLLVVGYTGQKRVCRATRASVNEIARGQQGLVIGQMLGNAWRKNRFRGAYLRNTLWEKGYAVDTLETAVPWSKTQSAMDSIEKTLRSTFAERGERTLVFSHLSHVYPTGSSVYTTYAFRPDTTPELTLENWRRTKAAVSEAVVAAGGTISHQHGVGRDHAPYLVHEKGATGLNAIRSLINTFDAAGTLNTGVLLPDEEVQEHVVQPR